MIEYVVFASAIAALSLPAFYLSLRKDTAKKELDNAPAPTPANDLTAKEKKELDSYISGVLSDELAVIDAEPPKQQTPEPRKPTKPIIIDPIKETKPIAPKPAKPKTIQPYFLKSAFKYGIKEFVFNCEGEDIVFTPKQIFTYAIDYTANGVEAYLQTKNHTVMYAIKYSEYFWVILNNGEKIKIPTKVCDINCANKITIPDFQYEPLPKI